MLPAIRSCEMATDRPIAKRWSSKRALEQLDGRLARMEEMLAVLSQAAHVDELDEAAHVNELDECESPPIGHGRGPCDECGGFHPIEGEPRC